MSNLSKKDIRNLADLCKISCSDDEIDRFTDNILELCEYISLINEVDTEDVPICNHVISTINNVMRDDEIDQIVSRKEFLQNSPSYISGMIKVPQVIKF